MGCAQVPDDVLTLILTHLACSEAVPGGVDVGPTFREGRDAIVVSPNPPAWHSAASVALVSRRWRDLVAMVRPWVELRSLDVGDGLNDEMLRVVDGDNAEAIWAVVHARSPIVWRTRSAPGGDRIVVGSCKCMGQEGVSYDLLRWMGCMQALQHPCVATMPLVRIDHSSDPASMLVHVGMERVDTSLQMLIYGQPGRAATVKVGRALPPVMIRSVLYQVLHALAFCHARGISHGNLTPYRIMANAVDAARDLYLFKVGDFGFSPPLAAQFTKFLPVRPSRAAPEIRDDNVFKRYGPANDVWAFGSIFIEMAHGCRNVFITSMMRIVEDMSDHAMSNVFPSMCHLQHDLLRRMLQTDPRRRITAAEALMHPVFDGIRDECPVVAAHLPRASPQPAFVSWHDASAYWKIAAGDDFLARQPHLNARMWTILYDWMAHVSYSMTLEPRTLPVACNYLVRYLSLVRVRRDSLQLVGLCAMHLACNFEETMIASMEHMVVLCDGAYTVSELMGAEAHMLTTLRLHLHGPTAYDEVVAMVCGRSPFAVVGLESEFHLWCTALTLVGQSEYRMLLHDSESLARCVATLGILLRDGIRGSVTLPDGTHAMGVSRCPRLSGRVCLLRSASDWKCFDELIAALDGAMTESRDVLVRAPCECTRLLSMSHVLETYRTGAQTAHHLTEYEVRLLVDKFYPIHQCERDGMRSPRLNNKKRAFHRRRRLCGPDDVTVATVTAALGKQLLMERRDSMARVEVGPVDA